MATAIATGAIQAGLLKSEQIDFAEPLPEQQQRLREAFVGCQVHAEHTPLFARCRYVVLAVKPAILQTLFTELEGAIDSSHLIVSIAAGISLEQLQASLGTRRVVRVMPNTPCQIGCGASAISADAGATTADVEWVTKLMESVGIVVQVPDGSMHAITGLSGSGPAYIYLAIEALSDGAVAMGLPRDVATRLAAQTVKGAAEMVLATGEHPGSLKDQVTSPAGTTIEALRVLERAGTRGAFMDAVCASGQKSIQLGQ